MPDPIRILIADDHPLYREGIVFALEQAPNIQIVGQAGSAQDTVELARRTRPDLVLLDITMPGGGLNALQSLRRLCPKQKLRFSPLPTMKTWCANASAWEHGATSSKGSRGGNSFVPSKA